jgi:hypothetical protein
MNRHKTMTVTMAGGLGLQMLMRILRSRLLKYGIKIINVNLINSGISKASFASIQPRVQWTILPIYCRGNFWKEYGSLYFLPPHQLYYFKIYFLQIMGSKPYIMCGYEHHIKLLLGMSSHLKKVCSYLDAIGTWFICNDFKQKKTCNMFISKLMNFSLINSWSAQFNPKTGFSQIFFLQLDGRWSRNTNNYETDENPSDYETNIFKISKNFRVQPEW